MENRMGSPQGRGEAQKGRPAAGKRWRPPSIKNLYILDSIMLFFLFSALAVAILPLAGDFASRLLIGGLVGTPVVGTVIGLTVIAIIAVASGSHWGRLYHTIFSFSSLFIFPVGTILQGWALFYLIGDAPTEAYFEHYIRTAEAGIIEKKREAA